MDPSRVNEFGTSADDHQQQPPLGGGADQQALPVGGTATEGDVEEPVAESQSSDSELSLDGDNELRRRLHKSED